MEQLTMPSWRLELQEGAPLRIEADESVVFTFESEGENWERPGVRSAVVFTVQQESFPVVNAD